MGFFSDNGGGRSGRDRRQRSVETMDMERRSGDDRRSGIDRRRSFRPRRLRSRERRMAFRVLSSGSFIRFD